MYFVGLGEGNNHKTQTVERDDSQADIKKNNYLQHFQKSSTTFSFLRYIGIRAHSLVVVS